MARKVNLVIVCEDILHATFMRAFLYKRGFTRHQLTFRHASPGTGDAKRYVCEETCLQLEAIRKFASPGRGLIVVIDADNLTVDQRGHTIEETCKNRGILSPRAGEPVFTIIPKWEIENWLAYLKGDDVDEKSNRYYKYGNCESKIYPLVENLADQCAQRQELPNAPVSLIQACAVYGKFDKWKRDSETQ